MSRCWYSRSLPVRHGAGHPRPALRIGGLDPKGPTDELGTVSHGGYTDPELLAISLEALAVVGDGQPQHRALAPQGNVDVLRLPVAHRVRDRLLDDPEQMSRGSAVSHGNSVPPELAPGLAQVVDPRFECLG